jgi:uncharacterized protein (TIGR03437 family)
MKRVKWLPLLMLLASGGVRAQSSIGLTISLTQAGPNFYVDGQTYSGSQTFFWPVGSKHILQFPFSVDGFGNALSYQNGNGDSVEWSFGGWKDNLGLLSPSSSPIQTITAEPGLTSIIGQIITTLQLTITFPQGTGSGGSNINCTGSPGAPSSTQTVGWGLVYVNGTCISDSTVIFVPAGQQTVNAFPFPGYAFLGFESGGNPPNPALSTFNQITPLQVTVLFTPAKRVNFRTNPLGLQVTVDQTVINTPAASAAGVQQTVNSIQSCNPNSLALPPSPTYNGQILCSGSFDFLPQSSHRIGAPPTQQDSSGLWWVFTAFDDGLGQNGIYVADANTNYSDTVTGNFIPGMQSAIVTVPAGMKISIDGTTAWPGYNFVWGQGTSHTLSAPASQVDSSGRTWQFAGWSNGGAASQTVTVPTSGQAFSVTATYTLLGQVQVTSSPAGLPFNVNGSNCTTPCSVNQVSGTQLQVVAPASVPVTPTSRLDFASWSTGGSNTPTLQVTLSQGVQVYTATYQTSYALTVAASPANDATVKTSPASPDGFFPAGTQISLTPAAVSGFKFVGWGGDLSGTLTPGYLTMNAPHSVMVYLNSAPAISPAGIINAAGPTPDGSVAPGSIISIYGQNLASTTAIGPTDPLQQTLANVTVTANNILMPLIFVSPGQINAQVPVELAAGTYTLTVQSVGQQPVSGSFTVSRNAPGIFTQPNAQNAPMAAVLHQDGSLITTSSPARRKEIVSFYGTGFGPFTESVPDGFPAPLAPLDPAVDIVTINAGGVTVPAIWAGAAPTLVGMDIVQLQIVDSLPSATTIDVVVTVNGKPSATVQLPVQ